MKILQVVTYDKGGAGAAAIRLHMALLKAGIDSTLITLFKQRHDIPHHIEFPRYSLEPSPMRFFKRWFLEVFSSSYKKRKKKKAFLEWADLARQTFPPELDYFSFNTSAYSLEEWVGIKEFDIIHFHWVSDFVNWPSFFKATQGKKIVWTLHDMAPFTGGYHYSGSYKGYEKMDENDPFSAKSNSPDICHAQLKEKLAIFKQTLPHLHIAPLSHWLKNASLSSSLFKNLPHTLVGNTLDDTVFKILDKQECRVRLGIPIEKKVCLFLSDDLVKRRKGFYLLQEAVQKLSHLDILFVGVGAKKESEDLGNIFWLGSITEETTMSQVYNVADVVIVPSLEDNLPNTILEAMFCGIPVLSFAVGGIVDMIEKDITGQLIELSEAELLDRHIEAFLDKVPLDRSRIRQIAQEKYGNKTVVHQYRTLYQSL